MQFTYDDAYKGGRDAARTQRGVVMNRIAMLLAAVSAAALISTAADAKTVRWSAPTDIATLDPFAQTESFTTAMLHHVFEKHT